MPRARISPGSLWRDLVRKSTTQYAEYDSNARIRQEWQNFKPKEKVFIIKAIHTCRNAKDVSEVLADFVNTAHYMNIDKDFLIACLTACIQSKRTLGAKFPVVFRDVYVSILHFTNNKLLFCLPLENNNIAPCALGYKVTFCPSSFVVANIHGEDNWLEEVFEELFMVAIDYDSIQMLKELLDFAFDTDSEDSGTNTAFIIHRPRPNSEVLALACKKNNYDLLRLLVDRGYRLKPYRLRNFGKEEEETIKGQMVRLFKQVAGQRIYNKEDESFELSDQIQKLRIMELAVNPTYILACYTSLAGKYDWRTPMHCECSKEFQNYEQNKSTESSSASNLPQKMLEEDFHYCPTHTNFETDILCDQHLECNDPVTRCFLLAKMCSDFAKKDTPYRAEYRDTNFQLSCDNTIQTLKQVSNKQTSIIKLEFLN